MPANPLHSDDSKAASVKEDEHLQKFEKRLGESFKLVADFSDQADSEAPAETHEQEVRNALQAFLKEVDRKSVKVESKGNVRHHIHAYIADLDQQISAELNRVMHAPDFTRLEGAWRGLRYLVDSDPYSETQIKVLNIRKAELHDELAKHPGKGYEYGSLFYKINDDAFGVLGGDPFGAIIGDFEFDHGPRDMLVLREMSQIAASAHCPFIAAASPKLLGIKSWQELADLTLLDSKMSTPAHTEWKMFRESKDDSHYNSRFVALTMPRFLARRPYQADDVSESGFVFKEEVGKPLPGQAENPDALQNFVWGNSAYVMGANLIRAFVDSGWCTTIRGEESGGAVADLPCHTFATDDGDTDMTCPTEISISGRRESKLSSLGLIPLVHRRKTNRALFMSGQTVHKPEEFTNRPDATANANLAARLPYVFLSSRFSHYLKCIARDKVGSYANDAELKQMLQTWISDYVSDVNASPEDKRKYPLAFAEVTVVPDPEDPGAFVVDCFMGPHVQMETIDVKMHVVAKLPRKNR